MSSNPSWWNSLIEHSISSSQYSPSFTLTIDQIFDKSMQEVIQTIQTCTIHSSSHFFSFLSTHPSAITNIQSSMNDFQQHRLEYWEWISKPIQGKQVDLLNPSSPDKIQLLTITTNIRPYLYPCILHKISGEILIWFLFTGACPWLVRYGNNHFQKIFLSS